MPCTSTWLSSRASKSSSAILTVYTGVSLNWMNWKSTRDQVSPSLVRACSIFSSFWARSTISPTSSSNLCSSNLSRSSNLKEGSVTLKDTLVVDMSCSQCLSRMAGERRSATRGTDVKKFFTLASTPLNTSSSRTFLCRLLTSFTKVFAPSSMTSVRMSLHSVSFQSENWHSHSMDVSHTSLTMVRSSKDSWIALEMGSTSCGNSKMEANSMKRLQSA
mmetsp:Transcript_10037/g.27403  ORF Transcript_10037/g.27403 Transcript_10037/m.27403 type:complete len:218 (+) Transcript_10037:10406-11059(+)